MQVTDLPSGTLSFAPVYPCPFTLPALLLGTEGSIACSGAPGAQTYSFSLAFGSLRLPAGGLSVNGKAYAGAVDMTAGDAPLTWAA